MHLGAWLVSHLRRSRFFCEVSQAFRPGLANAAPTALRKWGWRRGLCGVQLPEDLAHDGGPHGGVAGGEIEAADEAADALVGVGNGAAVEEAAGAEGLGEDGGEAFDFGGGGGRGFFEGAGEFAGGFGVADEFVEADGDGLAQVHGAMLGAGGDAQEPVTVAEIIVGEAGFFGAEEERDAIGAGAAGAFAVWLLERNFLAREALEDEARAGFESAELMMQFAAACCGGADYEGAVSDSFGDGGELLGAGENRRGSDGGNGFAIGGVVGIYQAQARAAEIAHGAGGGADI
jgi:hypothetical protein